MLSRRDAKQYFSCYLWRGCAVLLIAVRGERGRRGSTMQRGGMVGGVERKDIRGLFRAYGTSNVLQASLFLLLSTGGQSAKPAFPDVGDICLTSGDAGLSIQLAANSFLGINLGNAVRVRQKGEVGTDISISPCWAIYLVSYIACLSIYGLVRRTSAPYGQIYNRAVSLARFHIFFLRSCPSLKSESHF